MENRFTKVVKNPDTGRTRTIKYGQAGKAADGGDRIRPGTAKGDAYFQSGKFVFAPFFTMTAASTCLKAVVNPEYRSAPYDVERYSASEARSAKIKGDLKCRGSKSVA